MTTVPHPTQASHAMAALYGTDAATLLAWQRACAEAAEALRPQPEEERLRKALTLAQDGHVTLEDDGLATVESRGKHYEVQADGACACPDAQHRGGPCKHALAVQICTVVAGGVRPPSAPLAPTAYEAAPQGGWPPTPHTAAKWDVHEAPVSACVKFRVGTLELTYTFRGQTDADVLPRLRDTLPVIQALLTACDARAEERRPSPEAAQAAAPAATPPPAPPTPTAPSAQASGPPEMAALVQAALEQLHAQVQERMAGQGHTNGHANGHTNGHANGHPASPAPDDQASGVCSLHQAAMELHTDPVTGDTWRSHQCAATGRFCKGARRPRPSGPRR